MMRSLAVTLCVVCVACLGCGGGVDLGEVSGTVTMDSQPVTNALVSFTPSEGGRPSTGATDENGKYVLAFVDGPGAVIGSHSVSVLTVSSVEEGGTEATDESSDSDAYEKQAMGGSDAYDDATVSETIPARYNTETELTFEVKSGSNTYDIKMTSD